MIRRLVGRVAPIGADFTRIAAPPEGCSGSRLGESSYAPSVLCLQSFTTAPRAHAAAPARLSHR